MQYEIPISMCKEQCYTSKHFAYRNKKLLFHFPNKNHIKYGAAQFSNSVRTHEKFSYMQLKTVNF